jgi:hypothetical protein
MPPELVLCSSAARTPETLELVRSALGGALHGRGGRRHAHLLDDARILRAGCTIGEIRRAAGSLGDTISAPLAQLLLGTSECLAAREHGLEQVAVLFDPLERLAHPEAARRHVLC